MVARSKQALDELAAMARGTTLAIGADVTQPGEVEQMFRQIEARWGAVEVLVSNAGFGTAAPLENTTDELWQEALELNLTAPFRCIRRAAPGMLESGWGRVVVIASVVAKRGEAEVSAYTASKHGVLGLVRSAAAEYARCGITVNAVCPGYVDTPMTDQTVEDIRARTGRSAADARKVLAFRQPIGRLIDPAEVAEAVHFCIVNGAISGQGINVDGGAVQS
ncbi:hypothetical protein K875_05660 [Mycobacterium [tuberculosis] TKK-01-0051]|uniref:3-oxoacyl-[acyl-carrier-protein] reductase MabA n=2 Tax=Mycobacterium colombiense TaxID=339268 RepID=A0A051TJM9_9MYCO|nr:hypothetical protein K875_05660 [Mycobacterium [tuberculosis] TKK-01-0051]